MIHLLIFCWRFIANDSLIRFIHKWYWLSFKTILDENVNSSVFYFFEICDHCVAWHIFVCSSVYLHAIIFKFGRHYCTFKLYIQYILNILQSIFSFKIRLIYSEIYFGYYSVSRPAFITLCHIEGHPTLYRFCCLVLFEVL